MVGADGRREGPGEGSDEWDALDWDKPITEVMPASPQTRPMTSRAPHRPAEQRYASPPPVYTSPPPPYGSPPPPYGSAPPSRRHRSHPWLVVLVCVLGVGAVACLHMALRSIDLVSANPLAAAVGWATLAMVLALASGLAALVALALAALRKSWRLALATVASVLIVLALASLVTYLGVNWLIDEAAQAFVRDPSAITRGLREVGERTGIDTSTVQSWIDQLRERVRGP